MRENWESENDERGSDEKENIMIKKVTRDKKK